VKFRSFVRVVVESINRRESDVDAVSGSISNRRLAGSGSGSGGWIWLDGATVGDAGRTSRRETHGSVRFGSVRSVYVSESPDFGTAERRA